MKKRKKRRIAAGIFLLAVTYFLISGALICGYGDRNDDVECDAAIVLGAAAGDYSVSEVYAQRLNHAAKLYEEKRVEKIITTGGLSEGSLHSDAYSAREYLISIGIPEGDVLMEEKSRITQENLRFSKEIMDEKGLKSALIVSDPLHMKRSMLAAGDEGIDAHPSPTQTSAYKSWHTKLPFLARETFFLFLYRGYRIISKI